VGRLIDFLKAHEKPIESWTKSLSHIAQVLALILAGIWTYKSFWETERPSLEPHLTSTADIAWNKVPKKGFCEAVLDVTLENIGKRSVDVTEMRIRGWLIDTPVPAGDDPAFFPYDQVQRGHQFFDQTFNSGYLIDHYPPGAKVEDSFTWYFKEKLTKGAYWQVTFVTKDHIRYNAESAVGDFVCNYDSN
jgi:hypothetical protein